MNCPFGVWMYFQRGVVKHIEAITFMGASSVIAFVWAFNWVAVEPDLCRESQKSDPILSKYLHSKREVTSYSFDHKVKVYIDKLNYVSINTVNSPSSSAAPWQMVH